MTDRDVTDFDLGLDLGLRPWTSTLDLDFDLGLWDFDLGFDLGFDLDFDIVDRLTLTSDHFDFDLDLVTLTL